MKLPKFTSRLVPSRRVSAYVLAATISATTVTAIAVQDSQSQANALMTANCDAFRDAAKNAVTNQLALVDSFMGGATQSMVNAVSSKGDCLGGINITSLDLSNLIPDLSSLIGSVISSAVSAVAGRVCQAVRDTVQTAVGSWNQAIGAINQGLNINGQFQSWGQGINYAVQGAVNDIGSGSGGSSSTNLSTTPVQPPSNSQQQCIQTLNGTLCPNGQTSTANPLQTGNTNSAAAAGAEFVRRVENCNSAISQYRMMLITDDKASRAGYQAACGDMQSYLNANAAQLPSTGIPTYPEFPITVPANIGVGSFPTTTPVAGLPDLRDISSGSSTFSVPVRP